MKQLTYKHTIYSCFTGYIVQAIINNFLPLLFLTFQSSYGIPLSRITFLVTFNFGLQLVIDLVSPAFIDKIGYRISMLPLALCGYFLGTRRGVICGFVVGLLNLLFSPYVIHPVQLLVDYPFAFGALGLAGVFKDKKNGLAKGYVLGLFVRYICAALSGIVFFGSYAPEGFNAVTWSLWYNFTYLAAEGILTLIIISLSPVKNAFEGLKKSL